MIHSSYNPATFFSRCAIALFALALCVVQSAIAGPRIPAGGENQRKPPSGAGQKENPTNPRGGTATGTGRPRGFIQDFTLVKESGEDENLVGELKFMPDEKNAKMLKLRVHRGFDFKVGDVAVDADTALEMMWKGLYATATWGFEPADPSKKTSPKHKQLVQLTIETVDVEGTIEEIGDEFVVVNAKPIKGDWPDVEEKSTGANPSAPITKTVRPRKIKLKLAEKFTKYYNKDARPAELGEFTVGQKIEAYAGFGRGKANGILLILRWPDEFRKDPQQTVSPRRQPPPKAPSGGGRKPGG